MANITYRINLRTLYDSEGLVKDMEQMAAKGWLLEKMGQWFWRYRRIEPKPLRFAAAYLANTSAFDPGPTEAQQEFYAYCAVAGWKFAAQYHQVHLFYTDRPDPVPIETDEAMRLSATHAAVKKSQITLFLCCAVLLLLYSGVLNFQTSIPVLMAEPGTVHLAGVCLVFLLILLAENGSYLLWYWFSRRSLARGGPCARVAPFRALSWTLYAVAALLLLALLADIGRDKTGLDWFFWLSLVRYFGVVAAALGVRELLKRRGVGRTANIAVTIGLLVVLSFVTTPLLQRARRAQPQEPAAETLRLPQTADLTLPDGRQLQWQYYTDELPLLIEDLLPQAAGIRYSRERVREVGSALAGYLLCEETPAPDQPEAPSLRYEIVETSVGLWFNNCLKSELKDAGAGDPTDPAYLPERWQEIDPAPWGADSALQRYAGELPARAEYLICWKNRMVQITFGWQPTESQMAAAAEKLKNAAL